MTGTEPRFDLRGRSLRQHAARGTVVNTVFLVGVNALALARGFLVAGFLTRGEYGVWGVLTISLGTLLVLRQIGVSDRYVQQDEPDQERAFQVAFTLECIFTAASSRPARDRAPGHLHPLRALEPARAGPGDRGDGPGAGPAVAAVGLLPADGVRPPAHAAGGRTRSSGRSSPSRSPRPDSGTGRSCSARSPAPGPARS